MYSALVAVPGMLKRRRGGGAIVMIFFKYIILFIKVSHFSKAGFLVSPLWRQNYICFNVVVHHNNQ